MNKQLIIVKVSAIVEKLAFGDIASAEESRVLADDNLFSDLGLSSINTLMLVQELENEFLIKFVDEHLSIEFFQSISDIVMNLLEHYLPSDDFS